MLYVGFWIHQINHNFQDLICLVMSCSWSFATIWLQGLISEQRFFGELIIWNLNESLVKCKFSVTFSDYNFLGLVRVNHLSFPYLRLKKHPTNTLVKISFMKIVIVLVKCCLPQNSLLVLHVWKWKWGFSGLGELDLPWL